MSTRRQLVAHPSTIARDTIQESTTEHSSNRFQGVLCLAHSSFQASTHPPLEIPATIKASPSSAGTSLQPNPKRWDPEVRNNSAEKLKEETPENSDRTPLATDKK
eukprot:CAMPEP_0183466998 /NCGR_PEP_ID=MMETSP0370-20130417/150106_1 /TAXON_ID=268820 /ORGANISM="Peridinium aciculiferum, Strain PAER-2" /LENGTH=104 /DNA_ID=CAMNT_0025659305 /DNA_START=84 /DNA_END=396 /DNA_ORIENTATION=+